MSSSNGMILKPVASGVFGALKAEETKDAMRQGMQKVGPQIPESVCNALHEDLKRSILARLKPNAAGQTTVEIVACGAVIATANLLAECLLLAEGGAHLSSIPQTDGRIEAIVEEFRHNLQNCLNQGRAKKISSTAGFGS